MPDPIQTARALFAIGRELLKPEIGRPYRLIGIGLADIQDAEDMPDGLFASPERRTLKTETTIDALRQKFGAGVVIAGRALKRP